MLVTTGAEHCESRSRPRWFQEAQRTRGTSCPLPQSTLTPRLQLIQAHAPDTFPRAESVLPRRVVKRQSARRTSSVRGPGLTALRTRHSVKKEFEKSKSSCTFPAQRCKSRIDSGAGEGNRTHADCSASSSRNGRFSA